MLALWLAMGEEESTIRGTCKENGEWKMRDEPSDDVSGWMGVVVQEGRMTVLCWDRLGLSGTVLAELGAPSALNYLTLSHNDLTGPIPPELGVLAPSLTDLFLDSNDLSGDVPPAFAS